MSDKMEGVFVPLKRESAAGRQHLHTLTAGAWLPFVVSLITGFIFGLVALVLAWQFRARSPLTWASVTAVLAMGLTWYQHQQHWFSLTKLEEVTGLDINRDGVVGDPAQLPPERKVHVSLEEIDSEGGNHTRYFDLPNESRMEELAIGLMIQHRPFTHREWSGAQGIFSDAEFRDLRRLLLQRGLIKPASEKDARQGFMLTLAGRKVLEQFLPEAPSPTGEMA